MYDLKSVDAGKRVDAWRELISQTFVPLELGDTEPTHFFGTLDHFDIGDAQFTRITGDRQRVTRTKQLATKNDSAPFLISLQVSGQGLLQQDGRECLLRPGDLSLYDTRRPYELIFPEELEQIVVAIPRQILDGRLYMRPELTATSINAHSAIGRILGDYIGSVARQAATLTVAEKTELADAMLNLLVTALVYIAPHVDAAPSTVRRGHLTRIKVYIESEIENVELSPLTIASALRITPRYLHRIFQSEGTTLMRWILNRRLEHAARRLRDPLQARKTVTEIAFELGFNDTSHFSKVFRATFGMPPRDYRFAERARLFSPGQEIGHS